MGTANEMLKGHLDALLLSVVAEGEAHGYALIERLRERSEGDFDLPEGTVYPALHRLEEAGLLQSKWVDEGRRRRVYTLTDRGLRALGERRSEWKRFARSVAVVLGS
jgi:PadR family transcriptional regulator PadR